MTNCNSLRHIKGKQMRKKEFLRLLLTICFIFVLIGVIYHDNYKEMLSLFREVPIWLLMLIIGLGLLAFFIEVLNPFYIAEKICVILH